MQKANWKKKVSELKSNIYVLYFALKSKRVPWYAKMFIGIVIGYAFSPIDLIPDFIPVLGYLDDMILLPVGVYLAFKLIPADVLEELKEKSNQQMSKQNNWVAGIVVILIWILIIGFIAEKLNII